MSSTNRQYKGIEITDADLMRLTHKLHEARLLTNCVSCAHFDSQSESCLKYNMRPPARVIALGCESWFENLPF